ncbi:MAG: TetR/AcrR family transcriptional regulator [Acidobacteriota bacterium]|nr:TetR/AcrR family transcriptional regulator [Acidobacteriota bacterium]
MDDTGSTTHDKLLREAARLFASRGYSGTSMSDIAHEVGVRKASLYNYYGSKADLLIALLEQSLTSWQAACEQSLVGIESVERRLAAYLESAVAFSRTHPQAMGIIRLAAGHVPSELRRRVRSLIARHESSWHRTLVGMFEDAIERDEIPGNDSAALALFWSVFIDGILVNPIFATAKTEAVVTNLQSLWTFFWRGVSGTSPHTELTI